MRDGSSSIAAAKAQAQESIKKHNDQIRSSIPQDTFGKIYKYPEWDFRKNSYLEDYCVLIEMLSPEWRPGKPDNLKGRYANDVQSVKRAFMALKPEKYSESKGMDDGHEIDFDRYVDSLMDLKTGHQMDNNFYIFKERKERSVASALVFDMSPSTSEGINGSSIFHHQKHATYLLADHPLSRKLPTGSQKKAINRKLA